jgi:hypothetical protein
MNWKPKNDQNMTFLRELSQFLLTTKMGAQPTKIYSEIGEKWIDLVHKYTGTHDEVVMHHHQLLPLIQEEFDMLNRMIKSLEQVMLTLPLGGDELHSRLPAFAVQLIELSIIRDLEEKILSFKDYLFDYSLESMAQAYKDALPTFDQLASKYAVKYQLFRYPTALSFWFDGNMMQANPDSPEWLQFFIYAKDLRTAPRYDFAPKVLSFEEFDKEAMAKEMEQGWEAIDRKFRALYPLEKQDAVEEILAKIADNGDECKKADDEKADGKKPEAEFEAEKFVALYPLEKQDAVEGAIKKIADEKDAEKIKEAEQIMIRVMKAEIAAKEEKEKFEAEKAAKEIKKNARKTMMEMAMKKAVATAMEQNQEAIENVTDDEFFTIMARTISGYLNLGVQPSDFTNPDE